MKKTYFARRSAALAVIGAFAVTAPFAAFSAEDKKHVVGMGKAAPEQAKSNNFWWPDLLDLSALRDHEPRSNPLGADFDYVEAFNALDLNEVKKDINAALTDSQDWWPADWGNYGPLFIRMTWHAAGTYRAPDGRGGIEGAQQRLEPLNSWPDNANLDKARRLIWPVKKKYGASISWGDLIALTGNVALENMGFKTYGFAGGRRDDWEPDLVYWGPEVEMLASDREEKDGKLQRPLGATVMGLIYVNPEGPDGKSDFKKAAANIRNAFGRMAMNDEETIALIAGGHTFGKAHGAHDPKKCVGDEPAAAAIEEQGFGWKNECGKGHSEDAVTSGLEGAWTQAPTQWSSQYLDNLLDHEWVEEKSPGGGKQWRPKGDALKDSVPDAHVKDKYNAPIMFTTDVALKKDPKFKAILERFQKDPDAFQLAFSKAWFKLIHRDLGPKSRYLGPEVPEADLLWQDPVPSPDYALIDAEAAKALKKDILASDLTVPQLVRTAWASASTFRASDMRGGANGARIALEPQKNWPVNDPDELKKTLDVLAGIQKDFNAAHEGGEQISLADVIVLGGAAAIEKAAKDAGVDVSVPFAPGRGDASQEQTDISAFEFLEPHADAFRNYYDKDKSRRSPTESMVDKADQLGLTVPEMTALIGGMRVLGANEGGSEHGVFTDAPGKLTNDFFVNLLDMSTMWRKTDKDGVYEGVDRGSEKVKYTATPVDLIYGSNAELRAVAETYAFDGAHEKFVRDFVKAWVKVMQADRFDIK